MSHLNDLMSGDRQEEYKDFAERYDRDASPYDSISDEETLNRYHEVAARLSEEEYQDSAREAFSRMSPEERMEFGRQLRDQSMQRGLDFPGRGTEDHDERLEDPVLLARVTARAHREHPDLMEDLLKNGGAGLMGGAMGDGITGGDGASGGEGGMMSNPAAKAALAGIVATSFRRAVDG